MTTVVKNIKTYQQEMRPRWHLDLCSISPSVEASLAIYGHVPLSAASGPDVLQSLLQNPLVQVELALVLC